jgi:hypothetical protein
MKKLVIPLAVIAIFSIIATSCKKSCYCYHNGELTDDGKSLTTKKECENFMIDCRTVACKWE